jgi:hypothetical protein
MQGQNIDFKTMKAKGGKEMVCNMNGANFKSRFSMVKQDTLRNGAKSRMKAEKLQKNEKY